MLPYLNLALFGLKQVAGEVIGETTESAVKYLEQYCADNSQTLPRALAKANDRAWKTLSISLAGDGWFDQLKNWFSPGDEKALAEQVRLSLKTSPFRFDGSSDQFRRKCLAELNAARQAGLLSARHPSSQDIAKQIDTFRRYTDRQGMIEGAEQVVAGIADDLAEYPNLARLLQQKTPGGPPLLVAAFTFFFRREVEADPELVHGLSWDGVRQLSASQEQAFEEVGMALATLGQHFEQVLEHLARIEEVVVETQSVTVATHGAVLDMQAELQRIGSLHLANADDARRLLLEVLDRVSQIGMHKGEAMPQHGFSIRSEDERNAVKQLLARFRQMPSAEQRQFPALLNGLGKLQIGSGDFDGARQTFVAVAESVTEATAQAEAQFNAYRAALEEKKWDEALQAIRQATLLDGQRFSPFPMHRYQPKRILGAGGFGTAFLCHDRNFEEDVVVKALHAANLERNMVDVFREAKILRKLAHPAIIGVHECEYADPAKLARPYIVMDYFPGESLEQFVRQRGTLSPDDLLLVARQIVQGMQTAHKQGILHRDLKPGNVLVEKEGNAWEVKIIDFGLALRRQTIETSMVGQSSGHTILNDSVAGTLKYAPPEQVGEMEGIKPGSYSDVYSFGKLCYHALFKTTEPKSRQVVTIPQGWIEMLEKCTEHDLEHRYANFEPVQAVLNEPSDSGSVTSSEVKSISRLLSSPSGADYASLLNHVEPGVRRSAVAEIDEKNLRQFTEALIERLRDDEDDEVREEVFQVLLRWRLDFEEVLEYGLKARFWLDRQDAVEKIGERNLRQFSESLVERVRNDDDANVRRAAFVVLQKWAIVPEEILVHCLDDYDPSVRMEAVNEIGQRKLVHLSGIVTSHAKKDDDWSVRLAAIDVLDQWGSDCTEFLADCLRANNCKVQEEAILEVRDRRLWQLCDSLAAIVEDDGYCAHVRQMALQTLVTWVKNAPSPTRLQESTIASSGTAE
jgi:serine/threonine protein kinase